MAPLPTPTTDDLSQQPSPTIDQLLSEPQTPQHASTTLSPLEANDLRLRTLNSFKTTPSPAYTPGAGSQSPESFHNAGFLALFAILGAAMVLASIWFFFWAKNGGFRFRSTDWDDYKSTVLRRKGPDGRTLSNATKSTKLGGSTIAGTQRYKWAQAEARSVVGYDAKGRKGFLGKKGWGGTHSILYSDNDDYRTDTFGTRTVADPEMRQTSPRHERSLSPEQNFHSQRYRDRDVQEYKKERPARVGGLNRAPDGSGIGSTAYTTTEGSEVHSESSEQPLMTNKNNRASAASDKNKPTDRERERAERKAREEAAKMERRWKKEAEEAAAALARERQHDHSHKYGQVSSSSSPSPPKRGKTGAVPTPSSPSPKKAREAAASARRASGRGATAAAAAAASEVYSNSAYTGSSGQRSASYYDSYRPRATSESPLHPTLPGAFEPAAVAGGRSRESSPKKGNKGKNARAGGYRRGADSDFD